MNDLIIARYNEPIEWILLVPQDFRIHIYNKGASIDSAAVRARATRIIDRPNAGRESESYLTHMIEHGPGSGPFTVFCQGDPFEHSPDFIDLLEAAADWHDVQPLSWCWKQEANVPPPALRGAGHGNLANGLRVRPELFSLATWNPVEFIDIGAARTGHAYRTLHGVPEGTNLAGHFFAMCGFAGLARRAQSHLVGCFSYGAIFAVRNPLIAELPLEALQRTRRAALGPACHGYVIERIWLHLFGEPFLLPSPTAMQSAAGIDCMGATPGRSGKRMPHQRHDIDAGGGDATGRSSQAAARQHQGEQQKNSSDHVGVRGQHAATTQAVRAAPGLDLARL